MSKYKVYYHVSPELNITQFQGRYSKKFQQKGLFVCPSFYSISDDWAPYVASKKHPRNSINNYNNNNKHFKYLTVYSLKIPVDILQKSEKLYEEYYEKACQKVGKKNKDQLFGAWGWGPELFIHEKYLKDIKIIGKKKYLYRELCLKYKDRYRYLNNHSYNWLDKIKPNKTNAKLKKFAKELLFVKDEIYSFAFKPFTKTLMANIAGVIANQKFHNFLYTVENNYILKNCLSSTEEKDFEYKINYIKKYIKNVFDFYENINDKSVFEKHIFSNNKLLQCNYGRMWKGVRTYYGGYNSFQYKYNGIYACDFCGKEIKCKNMI